MYRRGSSNGVAKLLGRDYGRPKWRFSTSRTIVQRSPGEEDGVVILAATSPREPLRTASGAAANFPIAP
jgi:hypothetical protein